MQIIELQIDQCADPLARAYKRSRLKPVILFNIQTAIIVAAVAQFATSFCNIALYYARNVKCLYCVYMDVLRIFRLYRCRAAAQRIPATTYNVFVYMDEFYGNMVQVQELTVVGIQMLLR